MDCSGLTSATIPNSVPSIKEYAFRGCSSLTSVTIPNSVISIEREVFHGCSGLTSVTIPNSVTSIKMGAFSGCSGLTSVTIPNSVTSIGGGAFEYCALNKVIVESETPISPSSHIPSLELEVPIGSIERYINAECWKDIPSIYAISNGKKYVCVKIEEEGESTVELVGYSSRIIEVDANQVLEIKAKNDLYKYCVLMHDYKDVSETFHENGRYSFKPSTTSYKSNYIKTYSYPTTVVNVSTAGTLLDLIGNENVETITSLKVSGNLNGTDIFVIRKMTNLKLLDMADATIFNGGQSYYQNYTTSLFAIGEYFFKEKEKLEKVILPKNTKEIRTRSFDGCKKLYSITIPNSVTSIEGSAFEGCSGLTSVTILCPSVGDWFSGNSSIKEVILGNQVKSIGWKAFKDCSGLTTVTIGSSVTSIDWCAFMGCSGLTSVTIPNSVTSIDKSAFNGCSSLTSVTIGTGVTSIGESAFKDCNRLTSVHISDIAAWCRIYFGENPLKYARHLFLGDNEITNLEIPNSVSSIGGNAFEGCSSLTSVTIPNSVTSIGVGAFYGCSGLTSVIIPNSVTSINGYAFRGCSSLTSVTIPNSVTSIGVGAFEDCSGLTTVTIPNSVTSIEREVFHGCNSLTSVTIPNSVTSIKGYAFRGCSSLTSVTIPNSVISIEREVFHGCSSLTSVTSLNTTPPEIDDYTFDESTYSNATLQVPIGCKNIYWLHPCWEKFKKIEELEDEDVSSIKNTLIDSEDGGCIYNLNGMKVDGNNLGKGIYIKNGKKVIIK